MEKKNTIIEKARKIKLVIFDVDGVMTDGSLYFDRNGEALKVFHVHDGYGIKSLIAAGLIVSIISSRDSIMVEKRSQELGVHYLYQGQKDKLVAYQSILEKEGVVADQVACMGDDVPDLPLIARVGLSFAPADAHPFVLEVASIITHRSGGRGAVREVCDFLLSPDQID